MDKLDDTFSPTGLRTRLLTSELDGKMYAHYEQDIEPHIEYATALRNDSDYKRQGIKSGFWHIGHIPDVTIIALRGLGIDFYRAPFKDIVYGLKKLNQDYLLTTTGNVV